MLTVLKYEGERKKGVVLILDRSSLPNDPAHLDKVHVTELIGGGFSFSHLYTKADLTPVPLLHFRFTVLQKGPWSYKYVSESWVTGHPGRAVGVIHQTAQDRMKEYFRSGMDLGVEVYEVWRPCDLCMLDL